MQTYFWRTGGREGESDRIYRERGGNVWNEVGRKVSTRGDAEEEIGEDERGGNIQELLNIEEW